MVKGPRPVSALHRRDCGTRALRSMNSDSDSSASDFEGAVGFVNVSDDDSSSQLAEDGAVGLIDIVVRGAPRVCVCVRV